VGFQGKRILLTGAAGGLGEITAQAFAEAGATLILSSRNEAKLNEIAAALPGGPHEVIAADLAEPGAPQEVIARAGQIDIFVANAGRPGGWALDETPADEISSVIRVNFEVPIQMVKAVIPQMKERKDGQIVLIASLAGKFALPDSTMYSSTKSGLRAFGWALRPERRHPELHRGGRHVRQAQAQGAAAGRNRPAEDLHEEVARGRREGQRRSTDRNTAAACALAALRARADDL
jgi:short-subunit dehydrogenase